MHLADRAVATVQRHVIDPLASRWTALESEYKSVVCAVVILGLVVGFGVRVPW